MNKMKKLIFILFALSTSIYAQDVNSKAPVFTGKTMDGKAFNLAEYKGKVVLLDFWASWCGPCKKEFPFLMGLQEKTKSQPFHVVTINVDTEASKMMGFLKEQPRKPNFPVVVDPEGKLPEKYKVEGMPTTVLIDQNGVIRFRHTGFVESDKAKFIQEIKTLLKQGQLTE
ncbi:MAG: TlpA family protein disulfide reductase [Deferribacteres bacterium]|nr:TlpA family protein disulfide reductase [candidate division KSB1 bacterium]MCB9500628.1 TlpA family protein disulfide reductase [Deferribacteres bacterium]